MKRRMNSCPLAMNSFRRTSTCNTCVKENTYRKNEREKWRWFVFLRHLQASEIRRAEFVVILILMVIVCPFLIIFGDVINACVFKCLPQHSISCMLYVICLMNFHLINSDYQPFIMHSSYVKRGTGYRWKVFSKLKTSFTICSVTQ